MCKADPVHAPVSVRPQPAVTRLLLLAHQLPEAHLTRILATT
jgi:hypothetical protein